MDPYFWWKYGLHIFGLTMLTLIIGYDAWSKRKAKKEQERFKHL